MRSTDDVTDVIYRFGRHASCHIRTHVAENLFTGPAGGRTVAVGLEALKDDLCEMLQAVTRSPAVGEKARSSAINVGLWLRLRCGDGRLCRITLRDLEEGTGLCPRSLIAALHGLERVGLIRRQRRPNHPTEVTWLGASTTPNGTAKWTHQ